MPLPRTRIASPGWIEAQDVTCWLTASELAEGAAKRSETRRIEWRAGRMAAKQLLWEEFGVEPQGWQVGREGVAPALVGCDLPGLVLSLSHSGGMGAATVSDTRTEGSAGIDIQRISPVHPGLCARVFIEEEREQIAMHFGAADDPAGMLLFWALKEAAIKARRLPWGRSLRHLSVRLDSLGGAGRVFLEGEAEMTAQYERLGDWWLARAVRPPEEQPSNPRY